MTDEHNQKSLKICVTSKKDIVEMALLAGYLVGTGILIGPQVTFLVKSKKKKSSNNVCVCN